MKRAIELAGNVPQLPFGAVIVDRENGEIVAEGWNRGSLNPTWHGEIDAINHLVAAQGPKFAGEKLALYSTAEPCPMCMGAIYWCELSAVIYGVEIKYLHRMNYKQILIGTQEVAERSTHWNCEIVPGVMLGECEALFEQAAQS